HAQLPVDDVLLRDVAERLAETVEMLIKVLSIGEYLAARGPAAAVERVHQRALARAAGPQQADELAGLDHEVDVLEQLLGAAGGRYDALQPACLQAQAAAAVQRVDDAVAEREEERPDAHALALGHADRLGDAAAPDEGAVDAGEVAQAQAVGGALQ